MVGACQVHPFEPLEYPVTQRGQHVDTYHGVDVPDPYRWLEADVRESPSVREWVTAQNKVTFGYLESLPRRESLKRRLTELWDYEKVGIPFKRAGRYYMAKNDGLQNHFVIHVMDRLDGPQRVLLNPNTWSADGTVALGGMAFSRDGRYVAYGIQEAGSDWRTWKVRDIETGEDLPDTLRYLKFTDVAWAPDSRGLYFGKYPDPDPNDQFQALNKNMRVMLHRLGTDQADDQVVYARPDEPEWGYGVEVTDDQRYLINTVWVGTDPKYRVMVQDLQSEQATWIDLVDRFENDFTFIDNVGPLFYFLTDAQAPKGRVIAMDIRQPEPEHWREIIPEQNDPLQGVHIVNERLVCTTLKDVVTQVRLYDLQGKPVRDVELPGIGSASGFGGERTDTETFYQFESYAMPPSIYRYDLDTGVSTLFERSRVDMAPEDYVTRQVFFPSRDGTRIPMFISHRRDVVPDGSHPTLLYGYGGFNISLEPTFSLKAYAWMEMGGVYAVANLRGGGEYGKAWHEAGKKMHKQNVFDDFIAAAETLIESKITSPRKLAIHGGSNGGLLVGACMTQRPDLFAAAVPAVGVMDMLRFDAFTAGRFWTDDYGSAQDSPEMFRYLKGYSPYHNLKPGTDYPATLVITADTDDRVVPGHSFKFAAELQRCHEGADPVLIRIETRAGHGSGKPTHMIIEEIADMYAFLARQLGLD
jgi:prolyl oligopeptidase